MPEEDAKQKTHLPHLKGHMHIKPEITWGHIMTTATLLVMGVTALINVNTRITHNESNIGHNRDMMVVQQKMIDEQKESTRDVRDELKAEFKGLNLKIDKLIDRLLYHSNNGLQSP